MSQRPHILYLSGTLPSRSETFVYREVFGLTDAGVHVSTASVHAPKRDLGDERLDALADRTTALYSTGAVKIIIDALRALVNHPIRGAALCATAVWDATTGRDVRLSKRPKIVWQALAGIALASRVRQLNLTHIHAHMAHVPTTIAMYAARFLQLPFSFTGHAVDIFSQRTLLARKLRRAAFVSCISNWHREFYQNIVHRPAHDSPIIRCGVDTQHFAPMTKGGSESLRICAIGRLVPKKGFDVLINALAQMRDEINFTCDIAGDGPKREALADLIGRHNLEDRITLRGALSNEDVRSLILASDVFALPCRIDKTGDRDGIPVVLMEAMACGIVVISGDIPTIRELVIHDETGLMVEPGSVQALVEALRSIAHDDECRERLAAAGRNRVVEEFSLRTNIERLMRAFRNDTGPRGATVGGESGKRAESGVAA